MTPGEHELVPGYGHPHLVWSMARTAPLGNGQQQVFRFRNGYGASVIQGDAAQGGRGLMELAVVRYRSPDDSDFGLCYDTPITGDVLAGRTLGEVLDLLDRIAALPPDARALPGARLDG